MDQDGQTLDIGLQKRRNARTAKRFFCKLLKGLRYVPHCANQYANNRTEVSHQLTRQRERYMRRFKARRHIQRFLSVHSPINNLFRLGPPPDEGNPLSTISRSSVFDLAGDNDRPNGSVSGPLIGLTLREFRAASQ